LTKTTFGFLNNWLNFKRYFKLVWVDVKLYFYRPETLKPADVTCWTLSFLHSLWLVNGKGHGCLLHQPSTASTSSLTHFTASLSCAAETIEGLCERTEHLDIFLFFQPITQWCSISDVLFTGGKGVSDFSVLNYY